MPAAEDAAQDVDLWSVIDEAEETVEQWPSWQKQHDADVYGEEETA